MNPHPSCMLGVSAKFDVTPAGRASSKKTKLTDVGEDVEEKELSALLVGLYTAAAKTEDSMAAP